jgi:hypothetical protein
MAERRVRVKLNIGVLSFRQFLVESSRRSKSNWPPWSKSGPPKAAVADRFRALYALHDELLKHRARLAFPTESAETDYMTKVDRLVTDAVDFYATADMPAVSGQRECVVAHLTQARAYVEACVDEGFDNDKAIAYDNALNEIHFALDAMV